MVRGPLSDVELDAVRRRIVLYPDGRWARLLAEVEEHRASTALVDAEREIADLRALVEDVVWLVGEISGDLRDADREDDVAAARRRDVACSIVDRARAAGVGTAARWAAVS